MSTIIRTPHFAVGPAAADFQPLFSIPLSVGAHKLRIATDGLVNAKRGQLTFQLAPKDGLVASGVQIDGFAVTENAEAALAASGLPFDYPVVSNGSSPDEEMISAFTVDLTVTTAGEVEFSVAAGNPQDDAQPSDVALIRLAAMQVD